MTHGAWPLSRHFRRAAGRPAGHGRGWQITSCLASSERSGLVYGVWIHGLLGGVLPFLILIVAGVQVASVLGGQSGRQILRRRKGRCWTGPLAGLGRAQARRLIDQGIWMDGRAGDVLIHEGEPQPSSTISRPAPATSIRAASWSARVVPGQLIGEATVLGEAAAIATVTLTEPSRIWCAQGRALNAYLAANPDARHALEHGFTVSLREKLDGDEPRRRPRRLTTS